MVNLTSAKVLNLLEVYEVPGRMYGKAKSLYLRQHRMVATPRTPRLNDSLHFFILPKNLIVPSLISLEEMSLGKEEKDDYNIMNFC